MTKPIYIYPKKNLAAHLVGQIVYPLEQLKLTRVISAKDSSILDRLAVEIEANTKYIHIEDIEVFSLWTSKKQDKMLRLLNKCMEAEILVFFTSTLAPPVQIAPICFILSNQN